MQKQLHLLKTFELSNQYLHVYWVENDPWFKANEVASFLGIKNIHGRLTTIDEGWKRTIVATDSISRERNTTFINEPALYEIILTMRMGRDVGKNEESAPRKFKKWVFEEVLPSIRKTGKYSVVSETKVDSTQFNQELRIKTYDTVFNVFERLGMDDRDRLMFKDYGRTLITSGDPTLNEPSRECSISKRLIEHFNFKSTRSDLMKIGQLAKKRYEALHSKPPPKREQYVDGTTRLVNHYTLDDYATFLDEIIRNYFAE